jgi:hypothetical protein
MNIVRNIVLTILLCANGSLWAQELSSLTDADKKEIKALARRLIATDYRNLLNTIVFEDASAFQISQVIENAYLPNNEQLFYDDGAIVEDDINPNNSTKGSDLAVSRYLANLSIFYKKTGNETIFFSDISTSEIKKSKNDYLFVLVNFKSEFKGEHTTAKPYQPTQRVAEVRIEKEKGQWKLYLTGIRFFAAEPLTIAHARTDTTTKPDSVTTKSKTLPNSVFIRPQVREQDILQNQLAAQRARYKKSSTVWGIAAALSAIGSIATYYVLDKSYSDYKTKATNNDNYKYWQSLTRDSSLGQLSPPLSFSEFARPGIYGVYLGAAATVLSCSFSLGKGILSNK